MASNSAANELLFVAVTSVRPSSNREVNNWAWRSSTCSTRSVKGQFQLMTRRVKCTSLLLKEIRENISFQFLKHLVSVILLNLLLFSSLSCLIVACNSAVWAVWGSTLGDRFLAVSSAVRRRSISHRNSSITCTEILSFTHIKIILKIYTQT